MANDCDSEASLRCQSLRVSQTMTVYAYVCVNQILSRLDQVLLISTKVHTHLYRYTRIYSAERYADLVLHV